MKLFFDMTAQGELKAYIEMHTAADMHKVSDKMHTHSEYDTPWGDKLREWEDAKYYEGHWVEPMIGRSEVIWVLKFIGCNGYDKLMREIVKYFDEDMVDSTFCIKYHQFDKEK